MAKFGLSKFGADQFGAFAYVTQLFTHSYQLFIEIGETTFTHAYKVFAVFTGKLFEHVYHLLGIVGLWEPREEPAAGGWGKRTTDV